MHGLRSQRSIGIFNTSVIEYQFRRTHRVFTQTRFWSSVTKYCDSLLQDSGQTFVWTYRSPSLEKKESMFNAFSMNVSDTYIFFQKRGYAMHGFFEMNKAFNSQKHIAFCFRG